MKKNKMRKTFIFVLIAAILLTRQGLPVLAETAESENQIGMSEPEKPVETPEGETENPGETPEGEPESDPETAESEPKENESETPESESEENESETPESESEENESETPEPEQVENQTETPIKQIDAKINPITTAVPDDILAKCIVRGQNPPGVIVNLFDYWQDKVLEGDKEVTEVAHDYYYWHNGNVSDQRSVTTYDSGISKGHLLRFGYTDEKCECCGLFGQRGAWNRYSTDTIYTGIVQNKLVNGFPVLNLAGKRPEDYGQYFDASTQKVLAPTEESLAYLFSPYAAAYKAVYRNVQGLFQPGDKEGSYYYNSTKNFASYNRNTNSFILYNSPGVAKVNGNSAAFCGQFFPFNTAQDVFNNYTDEGDGNYHLDYQYTYMKQDENEIDYSNYDSISYGGNGYIRCYAPNLNHYLGMTMEMRFLQPEGGYLPNDADTPMTFKFSGDDDVWIFIDGVLVADLGGLHDACSLEIDFSNGSVHYVQENKTTTLLEAFQAVYGNDTNPGGIAFRDNTFADNTVHTLKMFYLERGHMASNLNLDFNIQTLPIEPTEPTEEEEPDEEYESYSEEENTDEGTDESATVQSILPVADNEVPDSIGIPKTGDDSLIGWWAALSIISLLGIGATVCNLILTRKKRKK